MRASRSRSSFFACVLSIWGATACSGAQVGPAAAPEPSTPSESDPAEAKQARPKPEVAPSETESDDASVSEKPKETTIEPEFKPGMSVEQAISAVPDGVPRLNMEQEVLSAPLQNPDLYAPCKPNASQHFKLRLAVWNGRVVGLDLSVTPKNAALESCLREQLNKIEWKDRVASLNTIEYAF